MSDIYRNYQVAKRAPNGVSCRDLAGNHFHESQAQRELKKIAT
jgi:hypothetical protein